MYSDSRGKYNVLSSMYSVKDILGEGNRIIGIDSVHTGTVQKVVHVSLCLLSRFWGRVTGEICTLFSKPMDAG